MSQQINLFNPRMQRQKNYFNTVNLMAALGVILLGVVVASMLAQHQLATTEREAAQVKSELAARETRKASATAAFVPRRKDPALQQQLEQVTVEYRNLQQVAAMLDRDHGTGGDTHGYSMYFRALARKRIDGLWLTGVSIRGGGETIGLQGRALKASLLPGYLDGLAGESVLRGKTFDRLEMREPKPDAGVPLQEVKPPRYVEFSLQSAAQNEAGRP